MNICFLSLLRNCVLLSTIALLGARSEPVKALDSDGNVLQWRSDIHRTGYKNVTLQFTSEKRIERKFRFDGLNKGAHTAAKASPLMLNDNESFLIPGDSDILYRIGFNGDILWSAARRGFASVGFHSTPCVVYGGGQDNKKDLAIIGSYDGMLTAFDLENGNEIWATEVGEHIGASPACTLGNVYISVEFSYPRPAGGLCKVDVATGEKIWCNYSMGSHSHCSPAIDFDLGIVVAGSNDGKLHIFREADGMKLAEYVMWDEEKHEDKVFKRIDKIEGKADIKGAILMWKGIAIFGSWAGAIHSADLNEFKGNEDWGSEIDTRTQRKQYWEQDVPSHEDDLIMSSAAIDPETELIYIGGHDHFICCIDFKSGKVVWEYETDSYIISSPVVLQNAVVVGSCDGKVYALDKANGSSLWKFIKGRTGRISSSVDISSDGSIMAFASSAYGYTAEANCNGKAGAVIVVGVKEEDDDEEKAEVGEASEKEAEL